MFNYEQDYLRQAGRPDLADRVRWVAKEDGDSLGFDILTYDAQGNVRHVEAKATGLGPESPFYLSLAELDFARRHPDSYVLYRVFNVLNEPNFTWLRAAKSTS